MNKEQIGIYFMVSGTLVSGFLSRELTGVFTTNQNAKNLAFIIGIVFGGMASAKMLKKIKTT